MSKIKKKKTMDESNMQNEFFFKLNLIHNLHFTTNLFKLTILDNHLTRHYVTDKKLQDVLPKKIF